MKARKSALVGRTIVAVKWNRFDDGRGKTATDPVLILDNGRHVFFLTQETDVGEYGTRIEITERKKARA